MKRGMDRRDFIADQRRSRDGVELPAEYSRSRDQVDGNNNNTTSIQKVENVYRPSSSKVVVPTEYRRSMDRTAELPAGRSDLPVDYQRSPLDRVEREFRLSIGRADTTDYPASPYTRSADRIDVPPEYRRSVGKVEDWRRSIDHMEMPTNARSADKLDNPTARRSMDNRQGRDITRRASREIAIQTDLANTERTPTKRSPAKSHAAVSSDRRRSVDKQDPSTSDRRRSTERKSMDRERRRSISVDKENRRSVLVKRGRRMSSGSNLDDQSELDLSNQRLPKLYSNRELPPGSTDAVLGVHNYDDL